MDMSTEYMREVQRFEKLTESLVSESHSADNLENQTLNEILTRIKAQVAIIDSFLTKSIVEPLQPVADTGSTVEIPKSE